MRPIPLLLPLIPLTLLMGCGNAIDCAVNGDNLSGRVTFGSGVTVQSTANVVVQYSTTSFGSDKIPTAKANPQGLLSVPYSFCVGAGTFQLRAFQDLNGNNDLDTGEPSGLLDGTTTGNAAYVAKTVTQSGSTDRVSDADIVIDNP